MQRYALVCLSFVIVACAAPKAPPAPAPAPAPAQVASTPTPAATPAKPDAESAVEQHRGGIEMCELGHGQMCLGLGMDFKEPEIDDLVTSTKLLARACDLGVAAGCFELGQSSTIASVIPSIILSFCSAENTRPVSGRVRAARWPLFIFKQADTRASMTIKVPAYIVVLACALGGCVDDKDPQLTGPASSTATTGGPTGAPTTEDPTGQTGGDPTGGLPSMEICEQYLDCVAKVAPDGLPGAQQGFGPDGTCWQGSSATAEQCLEACQAGLEQWHKAFPDEPKCGPAGDTGDTGDTGNTGDTGPMGGVDGMYLLAIATTVDRDLPLQFLATINTDASSLLTLTLQPLTLDQGKVTTPRQPIGTPLKSMDIPVIGGKFGVDLGTVALPGQANPITGSDIIAQLTMAANIVDMDFICGAVSGNVAQPPVGDITGSTFAAVRIEDPNLLPFNVLVDCNKTAVTGP